MYFGICFDVHSARQMNMDFSLCSACLTTHAGYCDLLALLYDVNCIYRVNFPARVERNDYLHFPLHKNIYYGIGDMHVGGHIPECFPRYSSQFIPHIGVVDGEIVESLWSVLNEISPSMQTATLANRTETLDMHMQDSNWKKLLGSGKLSFRSVCCLLIIRKLRT